MKSYKIFMASMAMVLAAGCAKEAVLTDDASPVGTEAKMYTFEAQAGSPMTRAYFKDDEAPDRYIYWEADDSFDFHDITMSADGWSLSKSSGKPDEVAADGKSVTFNKEAHDYMVITYPAGAVEILSSLEAKTWVDSKTTLTDTISNYAVVKVNVSREQKLSSVLSPSELPMATARMALSETAVQAVKDGTDTISVVHEGPVKVYPLAGIAKMTVTGLPDVSSAKIVKVNILSEFSSTSSSTGTPQRGLRGDNVFFLGGDMDLAANFTSGDTRFDLTLTDSEGIDYTAENGADVVFVADHSNFGVKTLQVVVYTSDNAVYKKKFDMSKAEKQIAFNKARISSFTLDFSDGTVSKLSSDSFSVEWAKGYLTYDSDNKAYKIAEKEDVGLYFKFGSSAGVAFYPTTEDYNYRIHPVNPETGEYYVASGFIPGGQTMGNGTDFFHYNYYSGGNLYYGENPLWKEKKYYHVSDGAVVEGTLATVTEFNEVGGSVDFDANDPCAYVKVSDGEKKWRLPTVEEVQNLIDVGAPGIEFGSFEGKDIRSSGDGLTRFVHYTDGLQDLYFKAAGFITNNFTKAGANSDGVTETQNLQITYSNKYAVYFWTNSYSGTTEASTGTNNYGSAYKLSMSTGVNFTTAASIDKMKANRQNAYSGDYGLWDNLPVRCVRDK